MLLRRVIDHVKAQNWTAVGLDLVIVVLGVFIGVQLGNWNEDRIRNQSAVVFKERLLADMQLESTNYDALLKYYHTVARAAETTYKALTGEIELSDRELVVSAFRASQYNWMERQRATYDELVASGNLDLIDDLQLRTLVTGYYSTTMIEEISEQSRDSEYRRAFRKTATPDIHQALNEQCGDRQVESAAVGIVTLDYPCPFEWPEERIASAAAAIRAEASLPALLRLQVADVSSRNAMMKLNYDAYELSAFSGQETPE